MSNILEAASYLVAFAVIIYCCFSYRSHTKRMRRRDAAAKVAYLDCYRKQMARAQEIDRILNHTPSDSDERLKLIDELLRPPKLV
jgi:hypothetical protein